MESVEAVREVEPAELRVPGSRSLGHTYTGRGRSGAGEQALGTLTRGETADEPPSAGASAALERPTLGGPLSARAPTPAELRNLEAAVGGNLNFDELDARV